jgi:RimJ/RimL family protein N-acetyltransferase
MEKIMTGITDQLFEGRDICLGPIDFEKDPAVESAWTHDSDFMRMFQLDPARPMSAAMVKKQYEKLEKEAEEKKNLYPFMIRARADDRLVGKAAIQWIEWTNGVARVDIGIGSADDRRKGYGTQAMRMLLRFAFGELNLYRVSARIPEYNTAALAFFKKFGFVEEIRRRKAVQRDSQRWDLIIVGLLKDEWQDQAEG